MKNRLIFVGVIAVSLAGFCGAIVLILYGPGATHSSDRYDVRSPKPMVFPPGWTVEYYWPGALKRGDVKMAPTLSKDRGIAPVYRVVEPVFDDAYARSIAQKLGIEGQPKRSALPDFCVGEAATSPLCPAFSSYLFESQDARLDIYPNHFIYARNEAAPSAMPLSIADEEATQIAQAYLSEHGLLPESGDVAEIERDEEKGRLTVEFRDRRLNQNLPDFAIDVTLDGKGGVREVSYGWVDLISLAEYPIISETEAFDRVFDGPSDPGILILSEGKADLSAPELYYEMAFDKEPESQTRTGPIYYLPFYRFCQPENEFSCIRVPALPLEYILPASVEWPPKAQPTDPSSE